MPFYLHVIGYNLKLLMGSRFTVNQTHLSGDVVGHLDNEVSLLSWPGLISLVLF